MLAVHSTVGSAVVLAYLVLTVLYALAIRGRSISWVRPLSFVAATLLLLQYLLGFSLWGEGYNPRPSHYILALLAIITVGVEHGFAPQRPTPAARAAVAAVATALTFLLVVAAYVIAETSA